MDLVNSFKDLVIPGSARLRNDLGRVFIFGGPMSDIKNPPISLRDSFYRLAFEKNVPFKELLSRPEDYPNWNILTGYPDLVAFERDACHLARLIVIFSESPGAHAELGAYATDLELSSKILVVIDAKYRTESHKISFINLGPIRRLSNCRSPHDDAICVISAKSKTEFGEDDFCLICQSISERLDLENEKTTGFKKDSIRSRLQVLMEAAGLFHVLELPDAVKILNHLDVEVDKTEVKRYFNILNTLDMCRLVERGSRNFLVLKRGAEAKYVEFSGVHGKTFDPTSFKLNAWKHVESTPLLRNTYAMGQAK